MTGPTVPRVSVTIPVYNGMPYIQAAVESVTSQLDQGDELVIVDNASSDGTVEYLRTLKDARIRVILRTETQDVAANWTEAIRETSGSFVKLICGDDLIEPGCLREQADLLAGDDSLVMVAGKRTVIDDQDEILIASHGLNGLPARMSGDDAVKRCLLAGTNLLGEPAAVMFKGAAIRAAMPWDNRWPYMLDLSTYARVASEGAVSFIHHPVARFRVSPTSTSSRILKEQPKDFRLWRNWQVQESGRPLSRLEHVRAELSLRARTFARKVYFKRVARRAARR